MSSPPSSSKAHQIPKPITVRDNEDESREYIYVSSDAEVKPEDSPTPVRRKKKVKHPRLRPLPGAFDSVMLPPKKTSKGKEPVKTSGPPRSEPQRSASAVVLQLPVHCAYRVVRSRPGSRSRSVTPDGHSLLRK